MRRRLLGLHVWLGAVFVLSGCSHDIDTPAPQLAGIKPNLACNQQITKSISVSGMNLTPLPTKGLATEVLNLPSVILTSTADLTGAASPGQPITLPGSGDDPMGGHVRWQSEMSMAFDIYPTLSLAPGLYDVEVANPDGKKASLSQALAVVPPPMITKVKPPNICDAQSDQMIVVTGNDFLSVDQTTPTVAVLDMSGTVVFSTAMTTLSGCTPVPMRTPMLQECTTLAFTIPKGAIPPGTYMLRVTNPADAECSSTESIPFVVNPPPKIGDVLPNHICAGGGPLAVKGSGFQSGATVSLTDGGMMTPASSVMVTSDGTTANATFGAVNGQPGDMVDVTLTNPDGCTDTKPKAVTIVPGPIVFYVDPPFVYSGITTPATIYTTGIQAPLSSVTLTPHGGGTAIDLTSKAMIDPNHMKHIILDVPSGLAAGAYDLSVVDATGCPALYANAITVVANKTDLKDMIPPFGWDSANTDVTIDATAPFFKAGVRAYLSREGATNAPAVALTGVTYPKGAGATSAQITATVPGSPTAKLADDTYDLVTVNPDGTIGFLKAAFTATPQQPPVITSFSPAGISSNCSGSLCDITINGANFTGASVSLTCTPIGGGASATFTPMVVSQTSTQVVITLAPAGSEVVPADSICSATVTNSGANTLFVTGSAIAVLQPSFKILLSDVFTGTKLSTPRRAPAVSANGATLSTRFVYAIGGDDGTLTNGLPTAPSNTVDFAAVDLSTLANAQKGPGSFSLQPSQADLPSGISLAGAVNVGRFIYLVGGYDGTKSLSSVLRSQVLDPAQAPQLNDADLTPDPTNGLAPGLYYYRVSAIMDAADPDNPGGETLAGDEFAINVPTFLTEKFQVTLSWAKPAALTGTINHWRIYRTSTPNAAPGSEDSVFATTDASTTTFIDKGPTLTPFVAGTPLPPGALGKWATEPSLNSPRAGAGVTVVVDQTAGVNRAYIYAGFGFSSAGANLAAQFPTSYEWLPVDTTTGRPVTGATWTSAAVSDVGRWLGGAYAVTPDVDSAACTTGGTPTCQEYVYFGAGGGPGIASMPASAGGTASAAVGGSDVAEVTLGASGGALGTFTPETGNKLYGYGSVTAGNWLYAFGGADNGGTSPKLNADALTNPITAAAPPTIGTSWTPNGTGVLPAPRFLSGATFGPPFFFVVGGAATVGGAAVPDTYFILF